MVKLDFFSKTTIFGHLLKKSTIYNHVLCNMVAFSKGKWLDKSYFQTSKLLAMVMLLINSLCV